MTIVKILSEKNYTISEEELYRKIEASIFSGVTPFSESTINFLNLLSRKFLKSENSRNNPQVTALGYWLRKSSITKIAEAFKGRQPKDTVLSPRGIAFHLPPANVDTLFVYSWALSLLSGNVNIVRMPAELSSVPKILLDTIIETLSEEEDPGRHIFCSYDYNNDINKNISLLSDLRMIWGGDEKVNSISVLPLRPDGISLGFPDRYSYSIISEGSFQDASENSKNRLVENFYNDLFWFDQLGCGSPKVLFWIGNDDEAINEFLQLLTEMADFKNYVPETGVVIDKFTKINEMLSNEDIHSGTMHSNALFTGRADKDVDLRTDSMAGGMLTIAKISSLEEIGEYARRKDQTITHFGFSKTELTSFANSISGNGGYRIVPVGQALNFGPIWDGVDLLGNMTKKIVLVC